MRDFLVLFVNGVRREIPGPMGRMILSDYLRRELRLIGTKIVCREGDCGACSVLVGRPTAQGWDYRVVDSCILFLFQLDGLHVITVEGLTPPDSLSPVQQSLVDCHGSQCGFCTPGFVVAMTALQHEQVPADAPAYRTGLTGNLCRCTGYAAILDAAEATQPLPAQRALLEPELQELSALQSEDLLLTASAGEQVFCPTTLESACEFLQKNASAAIVAGATDLGVRVNKGLPLPPVVLSLNRIEELTRVEGYGRTLTLGALATWTDVAEACRERMPEFHRLLQVFGGPQIRNLGTVGGNIINASPIADSLPFLFVMEAKLKLQSATGQRSVNINDFYRGYKQFDLCSGELLSQVDVPLPAQGELLRLYKVSRRRDLDISSFTAAVRIRLEGERIAEVAAAFGGVGPTVLRARRCEEFLLGREFNEETMRDAGELAVAEVSPISDVRGSADYRRQLTRNILLKFYFEHQPDAVMV
jgi:xanthine dehydrogenase small subunit